MQLKKTYYIATNVCSRKKCYYFWWSLWLFTVIGRRRKYIEVLIQLYVALEIVLPVYTNVVTGRHIHMAAIDGNQAFDASLLSVRTSNKNDR